jgi:hypothetical protein
MRKVCQLFDNSIKIKKWQENLAVRLTLLVRTLIFDIPSDNESNMQKNIGQGISYHIF